jgi:hypothetical protein
MQQQLDYQYVHHVLQIPSQAGLEVQQPMIAVSGVLMPT